MRKITLWANKSKDTTGLIALIKSNSFDVNHILTASDLPVAKLDKNYVSGFNSIIDAFGNKKFKELGFDFPKNEKQLKAFDEKFKDYPFKLSEEKINPHKILDSVKEDRKL